MFEGFWSLGDAVFMLLQTRDPAANGVPKDADALPTFRVYGSSGVLDSAAGTAALAHTGTVTGATNASPIVVTSAAHKLQTGTRVTVASVGGNTAANGTFTVTKVTADTFSLDGSTGNASYTSGGSWHVSGLYSLSVAATGGNGFAAGGAYQAAVGYSVGGNAQAQTLGFGVV